MKLNADTLAAHLERQLLPAYLISGDEPLLTGEAADAVRTRARAGGFSEREVHFVERAADWDGVRACAANLSLFGSKRMVEIRLGSGKPGVAGSTALARILEPDDPDTVYLVLTPRLERDAQGAGWVKVIEARGAWVQIWPVAHERLTGWLRARAGRLGLSISPQGLELLAERTEGNLLAAHQELEKLRMSAGSGPISEELLLAAVADSSRFDVFQLGEVVLAGEPERALRMLAGLRAEGVEPTLALWALTKAMRELWGTLSGSDARPAWSRQAAARDKGARRAPRLPFTALARSAERADRLAKGRLPGNVWDELALLALELCARPALRRSESMLK
jgi:DNA polymerase III subunit delta